ncbi:ABC transporter ATP-binding protein [candidate division KSB1 bacterium]
MNNSKDSGKNNTEKVKKEPGKPVIIDVKNVYKSYPSRITGKERTVLNGIDLQVSESTFLTIVGPTGCGKTTLFRLLLGSEEPTSGELWVHGKKVTGPDRDRGVVFQKYSLFPHLSVVDNVAFGPELEDFQLIGRFINPFSVRKKKKKFREKAMHFLERVGLADSARKYPYELSGGMQQRAAIAQALIMNPSVLFMDEPFGALDEGTRSTMQAFILEIWDNSDMTVFFVTHDLEEALYLGTRIIVLSQYYTTDRGIGEGAKILFDTSIVGASPRPLTFKHTPEFNELLARIRLEGLDPTNLQHVSEFNLRHRLSIKNDV